MTVVPLLGSGYDVCSQSIAVESTTASVTSLLTMPAIQLVDQR